METFNARALSLPLLLLGVEDRLQVTRVEVDEDGAGVDGLLPSVLPLEGNLQGLWFSPLWNRRPVTDSFCTDKTIFHSKSSLITTNSGPADK